MWSRDRVKIALERHRLEVKSLALPRTSGFGAPPTDLATARFASLAAEIRDHLEI